jgi:hypothetical protein
LFLCGSFTRILETIYNFRALLQSLQQDLITLDDRASEMDKKILQLANSNSTAKRLVTAQFSALFPTRGNHDKLSQH